MTESGLHNVCIIGAGPAGVAASLALSAAGVPHMVLDSEQFPRHKPCGDIITSGVLRAMNALDPVILKELRLRQCVNPIWHTHTYPPNGKPLEIDFLPFDGIAGEPGCYSVSRYDMDRVLVERMKGGGFADFRENCRVASLGILSDRVWLKTETGEVIHAKMVIVATGSTNTILKCLNLSQPKSSSAIGIRAHFTNVKCNTSCSELFLLGDLMPGGFYITPLADGSCNVNLVVSLKKVSAEGLNLREIFEEVLHHNPLLSSRFSQARRLNNFEGSRLFLGLKQHEVVRDRVLIAGDSAGLIEFFSGNGIPQALQSGRLAGMQAAKAIETNNFSREFLYGYEQALYTKIQKISPAGKFLYPLLHKKWFSKRVLSFLSYLSGRPQTNTLLRDLLYDTKPSKKLSNLRFWYRLLIQ